MAKVSKADLIETVKRVALVAERNTAVQMKFGDNQNGLTAIAGEMVDLAFTQATKPVVISGTDADDTTGSFRYLLMPRRLLS